MRVEQLKCPVCKCKRFKRIADDVIKCVECGEVIKFEKA